MSIHLPFDLLVNLLKQLSRVAVWASLVACAAVAQGQETDPPVAEFSADDLEFFEQQVRPILAAKCWKCHGPDEVRGGLRLDHRSFVLRGGDLGPAVSLEDPADSNLIRAINYADLEMPPDGRLPEGQVAVLSEWIARGLPWPPGEAPPLEPAADSTPSRAVGEHWSYQPTGEPEVPNTRDADWSSNPVDQFILSRLEAKGLAPNPPASRQALIRRLYFDLLGLPPSTAAVLEFEQNSNPMAYEQLVDELLSRPQFGEKWGRHWLDLVRFAETNGYERDGPKANAWRYRDYVIAAFNEDKPYDRFVREQLAGDELDDRDVDSLIATGYYRLGVWDDEPVDADQAYYDSLDDVLSTTGLVFLGTTVGCARCHDHKIDPISQRDYYRLLAFFHNIQKDIHQSQFKKSPFTLNTQTVIATEEERAAYAREERQLHDRIRQLEQQVAGFEQRVHESLSNPEKEDARNDEVRKLLIRQRMSAVLSADELTSFERVRQELRDLRRRRLPRLDEALTIKENGRQAPDTFILVRGNAHAAGELVEPGFPPAISQQPPVIPSLPTEIDSCGRRLALANWLVDPDNPLTARVIVNRVWQHHFGRGLVGTASDFGDLGDRPTHPELLDYLATELITHDWQLKWLHRLILTSQSYRMSSADQPQGLATDPENQLFWRFNMRRLTAEELRDSVLWITGQLNLEMGGPSVYPKLPDEVLQSASRPDAAWGDSPPQDHVRRSVYVFVKRSISDPVLFAFDAADKDASCPVRFVTTVPTQALTTLNGEFFNRQARQFGERLRREAADNARQQVARALGLATSRAPTPEEIERGLELLQGWQREDQLSAEQALEFFCLLVLNLNETAYID